MTLSIPQYAKFIRQRIFNDGDRLAADHECEGDEQTEKIPIASHIRDLLAITENSHEVMLIAIVLLIRMHIHNADMVLNIYNMHRLVTISLLVATKSIEDTVFSNHEWARRAMVPLKDINMMEIEFLKMLRWDTSCEYDTIRHVFDTVASLS
jgi:hypothetical protein